jgi:preprotein translocase subunit SecG
MVTVVLAIHLLIALGLVAVILLQKSEGGGLGIGGGGGMSGFMTGRSTANLLTRATAILATAFFLTSIGLAMLSGGGRAPTSVIDQAPAPSSPAVPTTTPAAPAPGGPASSAPAPAAPVPAEPAAPSVPTTR